MNKKFRKLVLTSASTIALLGVYPSIQSSVDGLFSPIMTVEATTTGSSFINEAKALPSVAAINRMDPTEFSQTKRDVQNVRNTYGTLTTSAVANNNVQLWEGYLTQKEAALGIHFVKAAQALPNVGQIEASDAYAIHGVRAIYDTLSSAAQADAEVRRWEGYLTQKEAALGFDFIQAAKALPGVRDIDASDEPAIRAVRAMYEKLPNVTQADSEVQRWEGYLTQKEAALPQGDSFVRSARALASVSAINSMNGEDFAQAKADIQAVRTSYQALPEEIKLEDEVVRWEGYLSQKEAAVGLTFIDLAHALPSVSEINEMDAEALIETSIEIEAVQTAYEDLSNVAQTDRDVARWQSYVTAKDQAVQEGIAAIEDATEALETAKETAKAELEVYVDAADYEKSAEALAEAISEGQAAIDAANTIEEVNAAQSAAQVVIDAIETDAVIEEREETEILAAAKEAAKDELEAYVDAADYERNAEALIAAISKGLAAIDVAETIEEVQAAQVAAQAEIDAIEPDAVIEEREAEKLEQAILEAEEAIGALPALEDLTFEDADAVVAARNAVDAVKALNQEASVPGVEDLEAAELRMGELRTVNYLTFDKNTGTITDYNVEGGRDVVIPSMIDGVAVETIGQDAFNGKLITSVVIPESVTKIERYAFRDNLLQQVKIPKGVTTIEYGVFYDNLLESIEIPEGVTRIESFAFTDNQLANLTLPDGVVHIGVHAFSSNVLTHVDIPNSVQTLEERAFSSNRLENIALPEGLTEISRYAFNDNRLTSITIPDSVERVGYGAFSRNRLREIQLNEGLLSIEPYAFSNNYLTRVVFPEGLVSVGDSAFLGSNLTNITIGSDVVVGEDLIWRNNNSFRTAYLDPTNGGPGEYVSGINRPWSKVD